MVRRTGEGFTFLLLTPLWLLVYLPAKRRGIGSGIEKSILHAPARRWRLYIIRGLDDVREAWWQQYKLESWIDFWFHAVVVEFMCVANIARPRSESQSLPQHARLLVVKLAHFGDALHVIPMINRLAVLRPDVMCDLLVGPWCSFLGDKCSPARAVKCYTPRFALFNRDNRKHVLNWFSEIRFLLSLRNNHYDAVVSTSTMNFPEWLLICASGASRWIGAGNAFTQKFPDMSGRSVPYDSRAYEADRVSGLLALVGMPFQNKEDLHYSVPDAARVWAKDTLASNGWDRNQCIVAVSPGAGWPGKQWPLDLLSSALRELSEKTSCRFILMGTENERILTTTLKRDLGDIALDLGGKTSLDQAAALLETATLWLGNDSGPMHLAAAVGCPTLSIFGPTIASKWAPRGAHHRHLQKKHDCRDCISWHPRTNCLHDRACMRLITIPEVVEAASQLVYSARQKQGAEHEP